MQNQKVVHVAVAVIYGSKGRILVARRPDNKHQGGLWEFPGGKVEEGETVQEALQRELQEELDIQGSNFKPLVRIRHDYPDKSVLLDIWKVTGIVGEAKGNEGQLIQWVKPHQLKTLEFPEANKPIVDAVLLPDRYMITDQFEHPQVLFDRISEKVSRGVNLVQFRAPWLLPDDYLMLAKPLSEMVRSMKGRLVVKGDSVVLRESWCDGLHLTSAQIMSEELVLKKRHSRQLLIASCHNRQELLRAQALGVDVITLSPVRKTASHPDAEPLGMEQAAQLTDLAAVPVYWLGGMGVADIAAARQGGAQGIAAINAFWNQPKE